MRYNESNRTMYDSIVRRQVFLTKRRPYENHNTRRGRGAGRRGHSCCRALQSCLERSLSQLVFFGPAVSAPQMYSLIVQIEPRRTSESSVIDLHIVRLDQRRKRKIGEMAARREARRLLPAVRVGSDASFLEQPRIDGERTLHFARIERAQRSVGRAMHGGTSAVTTLDAGVVEAEPESHIVRMWIDHMELHILSNALCDSVKA